MALGVRSPPRDTLSPMGSLISTRRNCNIWKKQDWVTGTWGRARGVWPHPSGRQKLLPQELGLSFLPTLGPAA